MDQRLIVTVPVVVYLGTLVLFAAARSIVGAPLTEGQPAFIAIVGVIGPLTALGLIWLRNYTYGAPVLVSSMLTTVWFVTYFFFLHDNPANAFAVAGEGALAFLMATFSVVATSLVTAGVAFWLWYRESPGFRSAIDGVVRPPETSD
ncbi:hypothetical protein ACFO5R_07230 [Halosolutus amylolyticus]|uniref:Uncharacterized protein n=1 Tax=Halosolutus amylolyticus TaxID=2932267 RepID=A0ABD5PMQ7_9EURY|nr:hypothetical protein [Halosolutus amylolyticus]